MENNKNKIKAKLTKKFRLVVLNEASFEERFSFKLTRLNVFVFGGIFSLLLIGVTVFIIAFTPIKEYIPGYSSTKLKKQAVELFYKVDSLQAHVNTLEKFTEAIRPILKGEDKEVDVALPYTSKNIATPVATKPLQNSDSIQKEIAHIRKQLDSSYQAYYKNEIDSLQIKHRSAEKALIALHDNSLKNMRDSLVQTLETQEDLVQELRLASLNKEKTISDLNKQIALNAIETKHNIQSLSKENKAAAVAYEKNAEKVKKEVEDYLKKAYKEKERQLLSQHQSEIQSLNALLFSKEAEIDSLLFQVLGAQQKKIGELANEMPFKPVDSSEAKLFARSEKDSIFREDVAREDRFSLFDFESNKVDVVFFAPVKGIITESYNIRENHYAVDVAVAKGTAVKSVADGTVLFAEWTAGTGYVVIIEHSNKYISVYKHNEIIYRNQGDLVKTGEVISIAGSSGEYSTGPHLHFEMWHKGYAVNPENFIEFE